MEHICENLMFILYKNCSPSEMVELFNLLDFVRFQKSVPIRPAAFHLVNAGSIIDFMMRIFKHLLPTKIQNRVSALK